MKNLKIRNYSWLLALALLSTFNFQLSTCSAQGTAFTYQGQLNNNGTVANGTYNLTFTLYTLNSGGAAVSATVTNSGVIVTNGLFTVAMDFGSAVWNGQTNWLQIGVATNGMTTFTALTPRQQLTPVPYAIYAESASAAGLSGTVPLAQLPGGVVTNNESSVTLNSLTVSGILTLPLPSVINSSSPGFLGSLTFGHILDADANGNLFLGQSAGIALTSGTGNTGIGDFTLWLNTAGSDNTAVGNSALVGNSTGNYNVADGYEALLINNGVANTAIGAITLEANSSGYNNVAVGYEAIELDNGLDNVAIGVATFQNLTNGIQNTAAGTYSFQNLINGSQNIGLGYSAGKNLTGGTNNIYIGNPGGSTENGIIRIGTPGTQTATYLVGTVSVPVLTITGGSDLAEPFRITSDNNAISQGAVVVIDEQNPGRLKLSDRAYDPHVAGVISGANGIHPGIQMQQQGLLDGGKNVALTGRVYVQADAVNGAIKPGDLLTTSAAPGYAMKVTDHARAQGAILGKAMTALPTGKGMVLVLVTLQ